MKKTRLEKLQKELSIHEALRHAYDGGSVKTHLELQANVDAIQEKIDKLLKSFKKTKALK